MLVFRIQRKRFGANAGYPSREPRGHKTLAARDPVYDSMSLLHPVIAVIVIGIVQYSFVDIWEVGNYNIVSQ